MTADETPVKCMPIRMRRKISVVAAAVRRNNNKFWSDSLNELAMGQLTIQDFHNRPLTFCEEMVKSPTTPHVLQNAVIYQPNGQPKQAIIDGEIWPPIFQADKVRSAKQLKPHPTDVFVCTYPKCGTTWVQHIASQLLFTGYEPEDGKVPELSKSSPMIEKVGAECVDALEHPRLLKTHFTFYNCPKSSEAKFIFVARNPKDCLTSYYFHNRNFKIYEWANGDFDVFFESFASGQLAFGDYYDHLLSWLPHVHEKNVLFLTYEEMYEDLEDAVRKIGLFLGGRAAEVVSNPEHLAKVVAESHISAMKLNQSRWFPESHLRQEKFIRKGGSRDWKNYMSREQSDRLDAIWRTRMAGTIVEHWWRYETAWDENAMPEIVLANKDETESESEESFASVSRGSSIYTLTPYMPNRCNSMDSVASSDYGSVWSVSIRQQRSPESVKSIDSDE